MKKNMGMADRLIRLLIAAVVFILFFTDVIAGTWAYVLVALAAIFLLTSVVGFCPLYKLFGLDTLGRHVKTEK
ncbi:MAG: YgaP family membrane protein [Chitinophagaceae bacterium]